MCGVPLQDLLHNGVSENFFTVDLGDTDTAKHFIRPTFRDTRAA